MPTTSPQTIRNLASVIDGLRSTFVENMRGVGDTTIVAGAFAEAHGLENAVTTGASTLGTQAAHIDTALTHIVNNLTANAQLYAEAEERNEAVSTALGGLIAQVDGVFEPGPDDTH